MDKKIILAVAGAGKTYSLCNTLNKDEKNLILAYTNQNISNLKKELISAYGGIPKHTKVMTFHSFIYQFLIRPYEPTIKSYFGISQFISEGVSLKDPPVPTLTQNGRRIRNKSYHKKDKIQHYLDGNRYYCCLMSELVLEVKNREFDLLKKATLNLSKFFDNIYIDEFQDFREYDYKLLIKLIDNVKNITLVGDYFQHSVSGKNNSGQPFKKGKETLDYDSYVNLLKNNGLSVDTETLMKSRRCPENICSFVSEKLGIRIEANNRNKGNVIVVPKEEVKNIIEDTKIIKLMLSQAQKYNFRSINWGYSKGDTYDNTCVILTEKYSDIDNDDFNVPKQSVTLNKLYVALTRTRGNLYLIKKVDFDTVKDYYLK